MSILRKQTDIQIASHALPENFSHEQAKNKCKDALDESRQSRTMLTPVAQEKEKINAKAETQLTMMIQDPNAKNINCKDH